MPTTLTKVIEHVAAMDPDVDRSKIGALVREVLGAVGLYVNPRNDEIYDPAPKPSYGEQRNVRLRGRRY